MSEAEPSPDGETLSIRAGIAKSFSLLTNRERVHYRFVVGAQMCTALLDLMGVLMIGLVGLLAATSLAGGTLPATLVDILDALGLQDLSLPALTGLVAMVGAAFLLLKSASYGYLMYRIYRVLGLSQAAVTSRMTRALMHLPILAQEARPSQETVHALGGGAAAAFLGVLGSLAIILAELSLLLILGIVLILINPVVTIAVFLFFATTGLVVHRGLTSWSRRLGERIGGSSIASNQAIQEAIAGHREILVTNRRDLFVNRISALLGKLSIGQSDAFFASQVPKLVYESALVIGAVALTGWQFLTQDPTAAVTTLAVFLAAGSRVVPSMLRVSVQTASLANSIGQARSTYTLADILLTADGVAVDQAPRSAATSAILRARIEQGYDDFPASISLRGVTFTYPHAAKASINDVSLVVPEGSSLALVGSTGSGKSTLADLMLGVLAPAGGVALLGGVAPRLAIGTWPGAIGYVPQHVVLANGTVRENVALGFTVDAIDDDLVWGALHKAQLADFLQQMRDGLDTPIGERGLKLSGGQRQRLGLARALYSRPKFLVLDEATSALDAETEEAITAAMRDLSGSVTMVTVAHRLATVIHADNVAFLDEGKLLAVGTFDEVRSAIPQFDRQASLLGL